MAAPTSARSLPAQYPNSSAPLVNVEGDVTLRTDAGEAVRGRVQLTGLLSSSWRYIFSLFALRTTNVNPNFSQTIDVAYNQAQIQALSDQVAALSAQLGLEA